MHNFKCCQLAISFYSSVKQSSVPGHLRNQLLRASSSIVLNLSEGHGRKSKSEKLQFFNYALGSLRECQGILAIEHACFTQKTHQTLDQLGASIYKLNKYLSGGH